jgi:ABC-type multidrug transport system fused ATPase/permease subunit
MFLVFISALLAFYSQIKPEQSFLIGASVVMLLISILGLFLSWTIGDAVSAYSEVISEIIVEWKVCNYEEKLSKWSSVGTVSNGYRLFYVIASIVWLFIIFLLKS